MTKRKNANGSGSLYKRKGSNVWIAAWFEGGKRRTRSTRTADKAAAQRMLNQWANEAAMRDSGLIDANDERIRDANAKHISEHLESWKRHLLAKGSSERHCNHYHNTATQMLTDAHVETLGQLSADRMQGSLQRLRGRGSSTRTLQHARGAVRCFSRWAFKNGLTRTDLTVAIDPIKGTDTKRERRALETDEAAILTRHTPNHPQIMGVSGRDRAIVYRVALGTGFRVNEIRSLTIADLDLQGLQIRLRAKNAKNRSETMQPISPELGSAIAGYLAGTDTPIHGPAFRVPRRTAEAFREDMRRARIAWARSAPNAQQRRERWRSGLMRTVDEQGRVADFHALRTSFITHLVKGGAGIKAAQDLARHSDVNLTLRTYTRLGIRDTRGALAALPSLDDPQGMGGLATGSA